MKTRILIIIGLMTLIPLTFAEESKTFVIDNYIITTNHDLLDLSLNWDKLDGSITLSEPFTGTVEIQIPKSMPRLTNLDFETSLHAIQTDGAWIEIKETESQCFYHLEIPVNNSDYVEIVGASVAAGNWELVSKSNPACDNFTLKLQIENGFIQEEPPVPEPVFKQGIHTDTDCGHGTTYQDGICMVDKIENKSIKDYEKWEASYQDENPNSFIRIPDDSFTRQSLQTGKSLGDGNNILGWLGLIISLFIVSAYVIMKIKKMKK